MNIQPEDIDRLFRETTEQLQDIPPSTSFRQDRFWQQLQSHIEPKRTSPLLLWYRVAAGLLLLLFIGSIIWQFYIQKQQLNAYAVELERLKSQESTGHSGRSPVNTVDKKDTQKDINTKPVLVGNRTKKTAIEKTVHQTVSKEVIMQNNTVIDSKSLTVADVAPDSTKAIANANTRKPLRIVHMNELPVSKDVPEWQELPSYVVKAQSQSAQTPRLTITLTQKHN